MSIKSRVLMIGPCPPPFGGVSTVVKNLMTESTISNEYELSLYRTGLSKLRTPIIEWATELKRILSFILHYQFNDTDIYHIHTSSHLGFLRNIPYVIFGRYFYNGKIVLHIHGAEFDQFYEKNGPLMKRIIKLTLESANVIIITSQSWINVIKEITSEPLIYAVPNGFDDRVFHQVSQEEAKRKLYLPFNKRIILNVGHLEDYKGQRYLIESMREIVRLRNDVVLYIIGEGSLKSYLRDLINKYSLNSNVILAGGNKSIDDLVLWYNACDIFVLPSLAEGNPTVMFECLACGKPFIGSRVGGIPDIINSKEYGFVTEPSDSKDLSEKILLALNKKWDSKTITDYANQFTWKNIGALIIHIYKAIV